MRWRDPDHIVPPEGWQARADKASAEIKKGKSINAYSDVWRDLKAILSTLSNQKCWYCESRQTRADNAVDHFRPKALYPWLAFCVSNYRFACSFCNSAHVNHETGETQGKQDQFPLLDERRRAASAEDIEDEAPILLDPCDPTDVGLLDFRLDGTACPADLNDKIAVQRVTKSICVYNLNQPELKEERRMLALKVSRWIRNADRVYPAVQSGDAHAKQAFGEAVTTLAQCAHDRAELSAFVRKVIRMKRTRRWVDELLDRV